jgi:hypothetical protein
MKVVGIDNVNADTWTLGAFKGSVPFGTSDSRSGVVTFERKVVGDSDAFHAWQGGDARKKLIEKLCGTAVFGVLGAGEVHPHRNHVIGVEAGFYVKDLNEAADEKTGSDKKDERQSDFSDDKKTAETIVSNSAGGTAAAFLEELSKGLAAGRESRRETEEETGQ